MKRAIIAMSTFAFAIGLAGSVAAAPKQYVDVPAKHPAFESVSRVTKEGIIDGYKDGTFRGDKPVTRYELAQILDRALEKAGKDKNEVKEIIEKEMSYLNERTGRLEKKSSSIKFWGDTRIRYEQNWDLRETGPCWTNKRFQERIRIYTKADLSERTEFQGRVSAEFTSMEKYNGNYDTEVSRHPGVAWDYGKFIHKEVFPNVNVELGRSELRLGQGLIADTDGFYDGIRFTYQKDKFRGFYAFGDIAAATKAPFNWDEWGADRAANISTVNMEWMPNENLTATGSILYSHSVQYPYRIYSVGVKSKFKEFTWTAEAAKNTNNHIFRDKNTNAWMTSLWYKGAQKDVKGSWGVYVDYRNIGSGAIDGRLSALNGLEQLQYQRMNSGYWAEGVKGFGYGFNYTFAKNAVFTGTIEQLSAKEKTGRKFGSLIYLRAEYSF